MLGFFVLIRPSSILIFLHAVGIHRHAIVQQLAADQNKDDDVLKTAIGVVGDLAQGLGPTHSPHLRTQGILSLLNVSIEVVVFELIFV